MHKIPKGVPVDQLIFYFQGKKTQHNWFREIQVSLELKTKYKLTSGTGRTGFKG